MRWQIAMLYESMKLLGIEDQLVVAYCDYPEEDQPPIDFCKTFKYPNLGRKHGYLPLNKPYSLFEAINKKAIEQPFVLIDPDMIFRKPIPDATGDLTSQIQWYLAYEMVKERDGYNMDDLLGMRMKKKDWKPIGCVYNFKNVPEHMFEEFYYCCLDLITTYPKQKQLKSEESYWQRAMMAFAIPVSLNTFNTDIVNYYEMYLNKDIVNGFSYDSCLMHYWAPYQGFNKHNYLENKLPYEDIMKLESNDPRVDHFKMVAERANSSLIIH